MRNGLGMAIAAALLAAAPASAPVSAQTRGAPARRSVRPFTVSRPRPVGPPRRVLYVHPAAYPQQTAAVTASRPAFDPPPPVPPGPSLSSGPSSTNFTGSGAAPIPLDQLLNPTPGLGFDSTHLAAINSGLAVRAFIDPVTQHELAITRELPQEQPTSFFPTYFPTYAYGGETPVAPGGSQPEVIVVQQPVAQPAPAAAPAAAPAPAAAMPPVPPLPVGTLYLVRRDGSVIHAVAFSEDDGRVVYITTGGLRRSIALDQLDIRATEQRNAEQGTILHLSE